MKRSTGELSLVVITLLAISLISSVTILFTGTGRKLIISRLSNILDNEKNSSITLNSNIKKNIVQLSTSDENIYKKEDEVEKILKINLETSTKFGVDKNIESKLKKATNKALREYKINSTADWKYYKSSDDNYIVNVTNSSADKEYYFKFTPKKNFLLNTSNYKKDQVIVKKISDTKNVSEKLKTNEYNSQFTIEEDYDESYLSKAEINNSKNFNVDENLVKKVYENNIDSIVILNTYRKDVIIANATGFFLTKGIIATSWTYINESLENSTEIMAITNSKKTYRITGVVTINQETDLALLKIDSECGKDVKLGNISVGEKFILLGTFSGFGMSGKIGINLNNDNAQTNALLISKMNIGSPLWNKDCEVIGMVTGHSIEKDISNSISAVELKKYKDYYEKIDFSKISSQSIKELQNNYYKYKIKSQSISKNIIGSIWNKYKSIGNIENTILLPIIKISSDYNKLSIRYQNDIGIDNDILVYDFISELKIQKYRKKLDTNKKKIYKNDSVEVTIYYEFDYIIVIMEMV